MDDLKNINPQQMLENAFRAIYEQDSDTEKSRIAAEDELYAFQTQWCNKFQETFSFVSQYGGKIVLHTHTAREVKMYNIDKCSVSVLSQSGGYSLEVHPPVPNTDKCRCLERYTFAPFGIQVLFLTLPEITTHISKGLATSNADNKRLKDE